MSWKMFWQIVLLILIAAIITTTISAAKFSLYRKCGFKGKYSHGDRIHK